MTSSPLGLLGPDAATARAHAAGRNAWWLRVHELLRHHGLGYEPLTGAPADATRIAVQVTTDPAPADPAALAAWVRGGGVLVLAADLLGAPAELLDLAGVRVRDAGSGHVAFADDPLWTRRPPRALHALAGSVLDPRPGTDVAARWEAGGAAVTRRAVDAGAVVTFGVDLWSTLVRIEQGDPVHTDGLPASDGTAPIDDGLLKCEDGLTLSFETDRRLPAGEQPPAADFVHGWPAPCAVPVFDLPQADLWQVAFLQALWWAYARTGTPGGWLDLWPVDVPAVAHMSHDADRNDDADAAAALATFAEAGVTVTWCQVPPGGYSAETYEAITAAGHENALHYNALASEGGTWSRAELGDQLAWARKVTGVDRITSNKNHYTRWEGRTEFYEWCEELGLTVDESRGPSKLGSSGFPFGTAQLSFPMADVRLRNRPHDVVNLPLHTQDLGMAAHVSIRDVILDGACEVRGVAHFLFHGPHLRGRPVTRQACLDVARVARERGMPWWTARQLDAWERARRGVRVEVASGVRSGASGWDVTAVADRAVEGAVLVLLLPAEATSAAAPVRAGRRFGRAVVELVVDLAAGTNHWWLAAVPAVAPTGASTVVEGERHADGR